MIKFSDNVKVDAVQTDHRKAMREFDYQVRSSRPLIYIVTHEETRVIDAIRAICAREDKKTWELYAWDFADGLKSLAHDTVLPESAKNLDQTMVLDWWGDQSPTEEQSVQILILKDYYKYIGFDGNAGQVEHEVVRKLRNQAQVNKSKRKVTVLIGPSLYIPQELEKMCAVIDWPLPERFHISEKINEVLQLTKDYPQLASKFETKYSQDELDKIISSFQGLTVDEVELLCSYMVLTTQKFDENLIAQKKQDIIRKSGLIDWIDVDNSIDSIGGLAVLKDWLQKRKNAFSQEAKEYGLPENPKGLLLVGVQGSGKCFKKDTPILMYDGTIKNVQDVMTNDFVMGVDSTPRKVLTTTKGEDEMYDVIPTKGDKYTVNSEHVLSLKISGNRKYKTYKIADENNIVNITIKEYLKQSNSFKQRALGYRVGVNFPDKNVPIDPYFIGLWLGDGSCSTPSVTTTNSNIVDYLFELAGKFDIDIRKCDKTNSENKASTYFFTKGNIGTHNNVILDILRDLKLINNKHVPYIYKCNNRNIRLELLAGIIDTDGYMDNNEYEIIQKNKKLSEDIIYLARSLGFGAYMRPCKKSCNVKGIKITGDYFRIIVSGNTDEIPVRIDYKKCNPRRQIKNVLYTGIKVNSIGNGEYFGFSVDGDNLFLLADFTVVHNSLSAKAVAKFWGLPLLRLDMGKVFSGIVGSSEENIRSVIKVAESIAPCVIMMDEIDKGLSGTKSSNNTDGGTAARVFGSLLSWMQDKTKPVYIVATANDVSQLPPELLRKGRFDEIFFIDLPNEEERSEIFNIHIKKRKRNVNNFDINKLVKLSDNFTGAEIEASIVAAMYESFDDGKREVTTEDILTALTEMVPLATTMKEQIDALKKWASERARNASKTSVNNDNIISQKPVEDANKTATKKATTKNALRDDEEL
jgi:SpoVK/Ycf46/Vps4 family AAA+-type ATPase